MFFSTDVLHFFNSTSIVLFILLYYFITLILITAVLTSIGVFDKIARHAGAGTIVPITGFANSIVCSAMEFKNEGKIMGVGAKIFNIAGPVILYGTAAGVIYGFIYWIFEKAVQ